VLPRRVRRYFDERPLIGLVAGGVFGLALVVFLVIVDTSLVVQAYERSASSTVVAVALGAGAALGTVLVFAWFRSRLEHLRGKLRRVLGWAGIAWSALFLVAFVWTHPRHRDDDFAPPLEVAAVTYCVIIIVVAVCLVPVALVSLSRPERHNSDDRIRVWEVADKEPYFVAYCDCGWVGTAFDTTNPHAQDKAFRDARDHGTNVAPEVEHPLG
jgi:MFS family permease